MTQRSITNLVFRLKSVIDRYPKIFKTDELPQETLLAKPTAVLPIVLVSPQKPQLATTRSGEPLGLLIPLTAVNGNSNFDSDIDPLKTPSVALPSIHKLLQNRQGTAQVNRDPPKEIVLAAARNEATKLREVKLIEVTKIFGAEDPVIN